MEIKDTTKKRVRQLLYSWRWPRDIVFCVLNFKYWDPSWKLYGLPLIQKHRKAYLKIGERFTACSDVKHNSLGVFQKVIIKVLAPGARLVIGRNFGVSGAVISCSLNIKIGDDVLVGSGAVITDSDAHSIDPELRNEPMYIKKKPIIIEDKVFIGARSIILKGVTIGRGSVVGAGAVVTKDVPEMSIVAGNPAIIVGTIKQQLR